MLVGLCVGDADVVGDCVGVAVGGGTQSKPSTGSQLNPSQQGTTEHPSSSLPH